jgi:hypothetical protein
MNSVEIAYLTIKALRGMPTEEIRQVQLEVNALLETQTVYAEEYRRLLNKYGKVLAERHETLSGGLYSMPRYESRIGERKSVTMNARHNSNAILC